MAPFRALPAQTFDRVVNFRDMGGHRTHDGRQLRRGRLFRSGHLARATDDDVARLAELGLRVVFDFRNQKDIAIEGDDRLPTGTKNVQLPMPDPAKADDIRSLISRGPETLQEVFGDGRAAALMRRGAADLVRSRREPYVEFMQGLCAGDAFPALFHCSAGKDRAGWAGSVVLLALGVPEEEVVEQYLLSNRAAEALRASAGEAEPGPWHEVLRPLLEVRTEYIQASFEAVRNEWGDFDGYLHEGLGVSREQRERLRGELLE